MMMMRMMMRMTCYRDTMRLIEGDRVTTQQVINSTASLAFEPRAASAE